MKKLLILISLAGMAVCHAATFDWYARNASLSIIFTENVWTCVEKARKYQSEGKLDLADKFLRKAEQFTLAAEPFGPRNWPSHWPRTQESQEIVRYAPPSAYIYRILGDYSLANSRPKEAVRFYQTYLTKSYIPDAAYLYRLGQVFESENMYPQAVETYQELADCIETRNIHNESPSPGLVNGRIRILKTRMEPQTILVLDMKLQDIPGFISGADKTFKDSLSGLDGNFVVLPDKIIDKVLAEQDMTRSSIFSDLEDRERIVKILNARYIMEPVLYKVENEYVFQIRVYKAGKAKPDETFEYKNESYDFLPNYFNRFVSQFQGKAISEDLLIPVNKYLWSFETSGKIVSVQITRNGGDVIAGCENGAVYIFSRTGAVKRTFREKDEITRVSISPEGDYAAWCSLNGKICLARGNNVIYQKTVKNLTRGVSIGEKGRFWVYAVDNRITYADRNGEVFWEKTLTDWVESLRISPDCSLVAVGKVDGTFEVYNNEGNLVWAKNMGSPVERISFSPAEKYIATVTKNNIVVVYSTSGEEAMRFTLGDETRFFSFNSDLLASVSGVWNNWFYFADRNVKTVWHYSMDKTVSLADTNSLGRTYVVGKGKNVFLYELKWD